MTHDAEWYLEQYHLHWGALVCDMSVDCRDTAGAIEVNPSEIPEDESVDLYYFSIPGFVDDLIEKLHIEEMLENLTLWQRGIAKMRIEGYDLKGIAAEFGCSAESVNQALVKARKKLRGSLPL